MNDLTKNKAVTVFAAVALLLHALMPFFAVYQLPANGAQMASPFGDKVLLCTAEGFKLASREDLKSGKAPLKTHAQYKCPLCYAAAHGQGVKPGHSVLLSVPSLAPLEAFFSSGEKTIPRERLWRKLLTRSPPASFVA